MEEIIETVRIIPQERVSERIVEQIIDVPCQDGIVIGEGWSLVYECQSRHISTACCRHHCPCEGRLVTPPCWIHIDQRQDRDILASRYTNFCPCQGRVIAAPICYQRHGRHHCPCEGRLVTPPCWSHIDQRQDRDILASRYTNFCPCQ